MMIKKKTSILEVDEYDFFIVAELLTESDLEIFLWCFSIVKIKLF